MLALCLMLFVTYYAQNYVSIIGWSLVIKKIEEPTEWCATLVVVPKQNGKVRICADLTKLKENACHERYPLPAIEQILAQLSGATVFSILDANSGFWQIPLSVESA